MMAALSRIKALKDRREETARNEVRSCALALEQAARAVETCRAEAEAYSRHVIEQRDRFYDELETRVVVLDEVDEVRDRIAVLRRKEADLYLKVEEAEERRRAAALRLEAARRAHQVAVKAVEKFKDLVEAEATKLALAQQFAEDRELEDFAPRPAAAATRPAAAAT